MTYRGLRLVLDWKRWPVVVAEMKDVIKQITIGLALAGLSVACNSLTSHVDPAATVTAEVQLRAGSERDWVSVALNGEVRFQTFLDGSSPRGVSAASFSLDLFGGENKLLILWVPTNGNLEARMVSDDILLGPEESRVLTLSPSGPILRVAVNENRASDG